MLDYLQNLLMAILGDSFQIYSLNEISTLIQSALDTRSGYMILADPSLLISITCYLILAYGMFWIACVFPFRLFKKLLKGADRKCGS